MVLKLAFKEKSFSDLVDLQASTEKLHELQHFAELGRLSATLLHEISNPLSAALLHLELSDQQSPTITHLKRDMQILRRYVESARQQVRHQGNVTSFSIKPQLDQLKRIVLPMAKKSGVSLEIDAVPDCKLYGDPVKFQHLVANLILNAIDAYSEDGNYDQASLVRVNISKNRHWLTIRVTDWGKGIPALELPHLFEPFYTTKGHSGRGLGIGLSIVREYVTRDFHGSIKVSSSRRRGTQFTVKLLAQVQ
ncbi:MAG: HAMP domain-containing sensor histidine kinase [Patescibacteria group bacterium]